jgi:hypothetical protein
MGSRELIDVHERVENLPGGGKGEFRYRDLRSGRLGRSHSIILPFEIRNGDHILGAQHDAGTSDHILCPRYTDMPNGCTRAHLYEPKHWAIRREDTGSAN